MAVDPDVEWLLREEAQRFARTGRMPEAPGYLLTIKAHPETWERLVQEARSGVQETASAPEQPVLGQDAAPKVLTLEQVRAIRELLGRRFEPQDITPALKATAEALAQAYTGDFDFVRDVAAKAAKWGGMTLAQAKGVLNALTANGPRPQAAPGEPAVATVTLDPGMYLHGGTIYKVQPTRAGRLVAMRLHQGAAGERASFEYERGAIYQLAAEERMTLEQAKAHGAQYGTCCVCGATLTDPKSIEAGIGPVCAGKI